MTARSRRGFTVAELSLAAVIVGVLAAVAIPLFTGGGAGAKLSEAIAGARGISIALRVYHAQHGCYPAIGTGTAIADWGLDVKAEDLDGQYFTGDNYDVASDASGYRITVHGGGRAGAPPSTTWVSIDQDGKVSRNR